ncbi:MAG: 16S rRNA (adenine(1518)-N(6)/adenine(1519)-N(6))-dimethyltransferase RsmA [Lachnospiraceae bacterium]|nr:16S rRNA (adenine(1518)-N(6)/adenine(1519)-N(6))-dimethyltransferase RsmA [Lachnospiraceae bacterium]
MSRTGELIRKYDFTFRKKFGQNFLTDPSIVEKIVDASGAGPDDTVLEIGPGAGAMTVELAKRAKKVVAVEIDSALEPILRETLSDYDNTTVIFSDVMKLTDEELLAAIGEGAVVVANLPYYITTPIIMRLLEGQLKLKSITVMVQKEVADRMQAQAGTKEYGALSPAVQYRAEPVRVMTVGPECFIPRPAVDSSVIRLDLYDRPKVEVKDEKLMFALIRAAFNQRRKTLPNAITGSSELSFTREQISAALNKMGLDERIRGEVLDIEQYARLADTLSDKTAIT